MANATKPVDHAAQGVTDTTLGAIDLGKEQAKITGRELRLRKMVIQAGGVVPWHSHDDRPAVIYVAEGEIVEYASNCAVPIVHKAGETRQRPTARRTGGRTTPTHRWSCSSATCAATRTITICDGVPPAALALCAPPFPGGASFCRPRPFIDLGYRKMRYAGRDNIGRSA